MAGVKIYFLHGFLGTPRDWDAIQKSIVTKINCQTHAIDYFNIPLLSPSYGFEAWAGHFNEHILSQAEQDDLNILVGYSLGGRLALHALEHSPSLWSKVLCLSTNPGFDDQLLRFDANSDERRQRLISDSIWAEEFEKSLWDEVIKKWNAQPVFGKSPHEPHRNERDYDKSKLAQALVQWSLAKQKNFGQLAINYPERIVWLVGEKDQKYCELIKSLEKKTNRMVWELVPQATHRVLFDNPEWISKCLAEFISKTLASLKTID